MNVIPRHFAQLRFAVALVALAVGGAVLPAATGQTARPASLSAPLQAFAQECETLRYGTILKLEESLRGLKSGQIVTPDKAGTIRQTEADLKALRTRERIVVPALYFPPRAGQIGRLPGGESMSSRFWGPTKRWSAARFT